MKKKKYWNVECPLKRSWTKLVPDLDILLRYPSDALVFGQHIPLTSLSHVTLLMGNHKP